MKLTKENKERIDSYFENIEGGEFISLIKEKYDFRLEPSGLNFSLVEPTNFQSSFGIGYGNPVVVQNNSTFGHFYSFQSLLDIGVQIVDPSLLNKPGMKIQIGSSFFDYSNFSKSYPIRMAVGYTFTLLPQANSDPYEDDLSVLSIAS